jgi:hypothetical protein
MATQLVNTLNDLVGPVTIKVENRTTDTLRITEWIVEAIQEITSNPRLRNDFDELEVMGPFFNLIGPPNPVQEYADTLLMPTPPVNNTGNINMSTLDIRLWQDPPANTIARRLDWSTFQEVDKFNPSTPSQPVMAYRFGGKIGFYPIPDKTYQVQMRALQYYPFVAPMANVLSTPWILSPDWALPVKMLAAAIGFAELEENAKSMELLQLLHGDPDDPTKPGMLYSRKLRRQKDNWRQEGRLRPRVRPYSFGGRCR